MEVHIYNVKAKSQTAERKSAWDLRDLSWELIYFVGNSSKGQGSRREHYWGHISMRIHPRSCHIFPQKVATTLHSGSRKGTVGA